jgi:molybdenum cofactor guanylyltransferase
VTDRRPHVAGVVLAGGASTRFGGDKLRARLGGESLLAHAVRRISEVSSRVVVVVTPGDDRPPPLPADLRVEFVRDTEAFEGPLRATARGLLFVDRPWSIVAGGDMPDLQPAVLTALVRSGQDGGVDAAALGDADGFRPLPCVVRTEPARAAAEELLSRGERSLRGLLVRLSVAVLAEDAWLPLDPERRTLLDVDEPADLDRAGDL